MKKKQLLKLLLASLDGSLTREAIAAQLVEPEEPAAPATPPVPQPVPLAAPGMTLNAWMTTYAKILSERGYKQQTLKNRTANQKHVCRLWGERPLAQDYRHVEERVLAHMLSEAAEMSPGAWATLCPLGGKCPTPTRCSEPTGCARKACTWDNWKPCRDVA